MRGALRLPALHRGDVVGRRTLLRLRTSRSTTPSIEQGEISLYSHRNKVKTIGLFGIRPAVAAAFLAISVVSLTRQSVGTAVPFRDYSSFNDATLKAMTAAYDAAIAKLGIKAGDPLTSNVAAVIAALASEGERDPAQLCEKALAGLKKKRRRPHPG